MRIQSSKQTEAVESGRRTKPASRVNAPAVSAGSVLELQRTIGNQAVRRLLQSRAIQPKLALNQRGDVYEQEADRVTDRVMRMPEPAIQRTCAACASAASPCPACESKDEALVQRKTDGNSGGASSVPDTFVRNLGPGQPLDSATRAFFEPRFGRDFGHVRVHAGSSAADKAREIHARAFTAGPNIVFGSNQYRPHSPAGQRLLAHELTHTLQQRDGGFSMIQGDFESDFAGKQSAPVAPNSRPPVDTVRVQTYATQTSPGRWVDAPYGIYSPNEIPEAYQDRIMESGKAFQWRNPRASLGVAAQREFERLENRGELTVRDMRRLAQGAGRNMNIRIAIAKVENDYRFVGYDMSVGGTGETVAQGFVETEAGTTRGVGRALFADRVVRALSNRAEGMKLEVYRSQRTENFHAQIFSVVGRQGTPSEGLRYKLTTGEMIRIALAWSDKLTPAQVSDLNALLTRSPKPTAVQAEAALWRGSVVRAGGQTQRVPSSQTVSGEIARKPPSKGQAKGAALQFGAQALLSMQISNVRSAERTKAEARFQQLVPEIERLLEEGYNVTVTVEAEVPKTINIAGAITDTDPTLIVYFRSMYISRAVKALRSLAPGQVRQTSISPVGEVREGFGDPHRWDDPHELTLDQQIRLQMGDPDPAKKHQPLHPTHRIVTREQTFTPSMLTAPPVVQTPPPTPPPKPRPQLDEATKRKLAAAPSRVSILSGNINQYKTAYEIIKKLTGHATFTVVKEYMGGGLNRSRTAVIYWSYLDKPRAEALAEIVRAEGVPSAFAELSGDGEDAPGTLQINFGRDAEK
jgi:hypothetical protein